MSQRCDFCGKGPSFGNNVSRLGRNAIKRRIKDRTKRRFNANIQTVRTVIEGTPKKVKACTSCIKKGRVPARSQSSS